MIFEKSIVVDEEYHRKHSQFLHKHDDRLELLYICRGEGIYFVYDRSYPVYEGALVICNEGTLHGEFSLQTTKMSSYCCVLKDVNPLSGKKGALIRDGEPAVLYFSGKDKEIMDHLFGALVLLGNDKALNVTAAKIAGAILDRVSEKLMERILIRKGKEQRKKQDIIIGVTQYIDAHYTEPITVEKIAKNFHISESSLSHQFKKKMGISVLRYLIMRRIGEAQNQLMNTELPVTEIGDRLGFGDAAHFSSSFKKHVGITPSEYRANFRKL